MARRVMISGLTAAGKTTHCRMIESHFRMDYVSSSAVLLDALGIANRERPDDFWVSDKASEIHKKRENDRTIDRLIDKSLSEHIENNDNLIIDSWGMPWITQCEGFRIWLDSSLESRIWKSIVSHNAEHDYSLESYKKRIIKKDLHTRDFFLSEYRFDLFEDYEMFDLVVDIGSFIKSPTKHASRISIQSVDELIRPFIEWYLFEDISHIATLANAASDNWHKIFLKLPGELLQYLLKPSLQNG